VPRLSIVSFVVRHGDGYLHHHFVAALLNDLFGIQARGGCSCAGPYGHRLLGIDLATSHAFEELILQGHEGIKPGWARVNFNYFYSEVVFEYLVAAVQWVAEKGWMLLPHYRFDLATAQWMHRDVSDTALRGLGDADVVLDTLVASQDGGAPSRTGTAVSGEAPATLAEDVLPEHLKQAEDVLARALADFQDQRLEDPRIPPEVERLRWFLLPGEALAEVQGRSRPRLQSWILSARRPGA